MKIAMSRQLKVGLFVIFGILLTMFAVFLIGDTRQLWNGKVGYKVAFHEVAGLKPGAPVRMGGLDVGDVTRVAHGKDRGDVRVFVSMAISKEESGHIRSDSLARVVNKGLLGDKMIELTVGSPDAPPLAAGALVPSEEPTDVMASANKIVSASAQAVEDIEPLARALGDPKLAADIKGSAADLNALLEAIVHGDGTAHRLFYDHREADQLSELLANLSRASNRLDATLADFQDAAAHVRQGPGIAHAVLYDGEISKNAAGAMSELHEDLRAIRQGNGLAHAVLYGDDSSQHVMANFNAMSDDMRAIVAGVRQGKGTIGGLLVDPTVYENIKSLVGNVERNEVLRALVRYSIKADEKHPAAHVEGH
jgi:phospholipid/cholesterol/gamma-HCH transport system substrate-binding protein